LNHGKLQIPELVIHDAEHTIIFRFASRKAATVGRVFGNKRGRVTALLDLWYVPSTFISSQIDEF
jgi:hypothetical protein